MENTHWDMLTGEELTPENVVPFFDEYLRQLTEVNKDTLIDLMFYFDYALSVKDNELLSFMVWRIIENFGVYLYNPVDCSCSL